MGIISEDLEKYVETMVIDNKRVFTPFTRKGNVLKYTDHYAIVIKFSGIPSNKEKTEKRHEKIVTWNLNKANGWKQYRDLTTNNRKLDSIASSQTEDPDEILHDIEKELNSVKYKAFGKVKVKKKKPKTSLEHLMDEKKLVLLNSSGITAREDSRIDEIDAQICIELKKEKRKKYKKNYFPQKKKKKKKKKKKS